MRPDYPAAHSMDTVWFAVDREGHVAAFGSGEAGAVPVDGYLGEEWEETLDAIKQLPRLPGSPEHRDEDSDEAVLDHGVFYYGHEKTENILAGPYTQMKPVQPVKIDQLPPEIRSVVEQVRFESLSFASSPEIQPVDHFPCEAWSASYTSDGDRVRPIPGKESEYAEEYSRSVKEDEGGFKWEAPAGGIPAPKPPPAHEFRRVGGNMDGSSRRGLIKALIIAAVIAVYILVKYVLLRNRS